MAPADLSEPPSPAGRAAASSASRTLFARLVGARAGDLGPQEARDGLVHVAALSLTRTADALIDPKLCLSWLLSALGAPPALIGALTPVREAGALLPQLALARRVQACPQRKRVWAAGAAVQGAAAIAIAAAAFLLSGAAAGIAVVALVALLATGRAAASLSHKDALARTVGKTRRGAVSGMAGSVAALSAFGVGALYALGIFGEAAETLALAVAGAGALFWIAGALFLRLHEPERPAAPPEGEGIGALLAPLRQDAQLRRFILARALLTVTALAPPFIVMLSAEAGEGALSGLGPLMMASTAASFVASYVWGRLSDRSSRRTIAAAGALAGAVYLVVGGMGVATGGLGGIWGAAASVFCAQIGYAGVRAGRKLHLTDMAGDDARARYTALSNSVIGLVLLAGAGFGALAAAIGPGAVLLVLAAMSWLGALVALGLEEVQQRPDAD